MAGKTITEKIFSAHCGRDVRVGEVAICDIDFCFGQDGTSSLIIDSFRKLEARKVFNKDKFCMVIDHSSPSPNIGVSEVHRKMRDFAKTYNVRMFDVGCGVCHQIIPEAGIVSPGDLIIGADSHTCTYGALGAFSTGMGSTDLAVTLASGKNWFKIPETVKIILKGKPGKGIYSKDVILYIIGKLGADYCTYKAVEFSGDYIRNLSMDARFTITNMAIEMGAKTGIIEPDIKTYNYLARAGSKVKGKTRYANRSVRTGHGLKADRDAEYSEILEYDVSKVVPQVARPHTVDNVRPVNKVKDVGITEAFVGTCTNGRLEDLRIVSSVLKNRTRINITPNVIRAMKRRTDTFPSEWNPLSTTRMIVSVRRREMLGRPMMRRFIE